MTVLRQVAPVTHCMPCLKRIIQNTSVLRAQKTLIHKSIEFVLERSYISNLLGHEQVSESPCPHDC